MQSENDSYLASELRLHDRDRYILSLFVPISVRPALQALYMLNNELARVAHVVSEEMIGQVRLAWWQESLDSMFSGHPPHDHPVLQALWPLIEQGHLSQIHIEPLIASYRLHYPERPHDAGRLMESASFSVLRSLAPKAQWKWKRAHDAIRNHRMRYGDGRANGWLYAKLLVV